MVERIILKNKPLVEAIFEIKWKLKDTGSHGFTDENFNLLSGILYDKISNDYPIPGTLIPEFVPLESAPYAIRTQFREKEGQWPLVQIGPGILTVNDTESYVWEDFEERIITVLGSLLDSFSKLKKELIIESLSLRYIDALDFDYTTHNIYAYLKDQLKLSINPTPSLFKPEFLDSHPVDVNIDLVYPSHAPIGKVVIKFSTGYRKDSHGKNIPAIIWNTIFQSEVTPPYTSGNEIITWVRGAHEVTDHIFFTIIEGELLEKFR